MPIPAEDGFLGLAFILYFLSFLLLASRLLHLTSSSSFRWESPGQHLSLLTVLACLFTRGWVRMLIGGVGGCLLGSKPAILLGAVAAYLIPVILKKQKKHCRNRSLEMQLIDGLSLMEGGLRAGFSLLQVLEMTAREMEPPLSELARQIVQEVNLGLSMDEAWERVNRQEDSEVFELLVRAVIIQRQMGGDLGQVLATLRETVRQRVNLEVKLRGITSQGRLTGIVIAVLPPALAGIIHLLMPDFIRPLFVTPLGQVLLVTAGCLELVGIWMISRICRIDF